MIDLDFSNAPKPKCKHCGKTKDRHLAKTFNCPFGRGSFPQFKTNEFFEAKVVKVK